MNQAAEAALAQLPNIGSSLASELEASGIGSVTALVSLGSVAAAAALMTHGFDVCSNKLHALEGAIQGVRWHELSSEARATLWSQFKDLELSEGGRLA